MAIIKAIRYLGFDPYWWEVKEKREDLLNNTTTVVLCLYADPDIHAINPNGYIPGYFPSCVVPGVGLTTDECIAGFLASNINNVEWKGAVNTDESYSLMNIKSQVYQQISNDPITGCFRFAEIINYKHFCKNDIIFLNLNIYFDTIIPGNPVNADLNLFVPDASKTQTIPWIVDNYYKFYGSDIGEATYFISMVTSGTPIFDVLSQGISYGDQMGYINSKLS